MIMRLEAPPSVRCLKCKDSFTTYTICLGTPESGPVIQCPNCKAPHRVSVGLKVSPSKEMDSVGIARLSLLLHYAPDLNKPKPT